MKEFLNFIRFIHRAETLKFRMVFDIIVQPAWEKEVIHRQVIHSSRTVVRCFCRLLRRDHRLLNTTYFILLTEWRMTV